MSDNSESIAQFISMTNASEQLAKFYLDMTNGDLEMAVTQFFDNAGSSETTAEAIANSTGSPAARSTPQQPFGGGSGSSNISRSSTPTQSGKATSSSSSKIRSFSDLISSNDAGGSDDDEHENLYAGGEKSGMVVQGPNKRGGEGDSLVDEILKKAAQGGPVPAEEFEQTAKKPKYYTGTGYRLGSEEEPSSVVEAAGFAAGPVEEEETEPVTRYLTFWRNGFSVDDGPLFEYNDPANQEMLTAINSGRAPLSLLNVRHGQPVEVRVVKRQGEDYVPPPKVRKAFEGVGNRLGSPAPVSSTPSPAPGAYPATSSSSSTNAPAPTIDESQPITNIQIRLADGSRLVAKLNHTHTIADIRQFIESSRPASGPYILQTTFPVKELTDSNQTVKEAGLLNSVVVQRYQ